MNKPTLAQRVARLFSRQSPTAGRQRNYAAAQVNRLTQGWSTLNLSANADIYRSIDALRARSRALANDVPHMRKFLSMVAGNVVGPNGVSLQARVYNTPDQPDQLANDAIESAWHRWCARGVCEVSGKHSLLGVQHLLAKAAARDGEFLVRKIRGSAAGNPFGLALQVLDVDRIDTAYNRVAEASANAIRMGVEIDGYGRPVAYWLRTRHPGDAWGADVPRGDSRQRVPADEIIHGFVADRPEQLRGVPWAHASMKTLNDLAGYQEAAVIAARIGASKMGFFTTPDGQVETLSTGTEQVPGATGANGSASTSQLMMDADPGVFQSLPEGVSFQAFDPDYPTQMYGAFVQETLRDVATGLCVAYHSLGNNLEGVSFSSIRSGTLEERDQWMVLQAWFVDELLEPLYSEWLQMAMAMGQITMPNGSALPVSKLEKFRAHVWQPRRWEWVDPQKDIEAGLTAVRAGLKSPQQIAAQMGQDYEDVLRDIRRAMDAAQALGVPVAWTSPPAAPPAPPVPAE